MFIFLSTIVATAILADQNHPIYKRIILLDGFIFSKSDFTHALQRYSSLRDHVIEKLCHEGIYLKEPLFAKKIQMELSNILMDTSNAVQHIIIIHYLMLNIILGLRTC